MEYWKVPSRRFYVAKKEDYKNVLRAKAKKSTRGKGQPQLTNLMKKRLEDKIAKVS